MQDTEKRARRRKSVRLTEEQKVALEEFTEKHGTNLDASVVAGVTESSYSRLRREGKASPDTVNKVLTVVCPPAQSGEQQEAA